MSAVAALLDALTAHGRAVETSHSGSTRPLIGIDKFRLLLDLLEAEGDRLEALRVREEVMAGGDAGTVR